MTFFLFFPHKTGLTFHTNGLQGRKFAWNVKSCQAKNGVFKHVQNAHIQSYLGVCSPLIHSILSMNLAADSECPGPEVLKLFSCSTQLSMKFSLLINMKMPIVGIFIFISRENFMLSYV